MGVYVPSLWIRADNKKLLTSKVQQKWGCVTSRLVHKRQVIQWPHSMAYSALNPKRPQERSTHSESSVFEEVTCLQSAAVAFSPNPQAWVPAVWVSRPPKDVGLQPLSRLWPRVSPVEASDFTEQAQDIYLLCPLWIPDLRTMAMINWTWL